LRLSVYFCSWVGVKIDTKEKPYSIKLTDGGKIEISNKVSCDSKADPVSNQIHSEPPNRITFAEKKELL
jgi:hypothetical protein